MPCYRCGTRQVDPDRGESPWKRGVRGDRQVLVCPACQASYDWTSDLDGCPVCSSVHLVRRLGEVECRDCGFVRQPVASSLPGHLSGLPAGSREEAPGELALSSAVTAGGGSGPGGGAGPGGSSGPGADSGSDSEMVAMRGLARDVEQALARVLGRTATSG